MNDDHGSRCGAALADDRRDLRLRDRAESLAGDARAHQALAQFRQCRDEHRIDVRHRRRAGGDDQHSARKGRRSPALCCAGCRDVGRAAAPVELSARGADHPFGHLGLGNRPQHAVLSRLERRAGLGRPGGDRPGPRARDDGRAELRSHRCGRPADRWRNGHVEAARAARQASRHHQQPVRHEGARSGDALRPCST